MSALSDLQGNVAEKLSDAPGVGGFVPAQSDTVPDANGGFRGIWVGVTGNIKLTHLDQSIATYTNVPVGLFPVGGTMVWVTGTTATTMVCIR